MVELRWLKRALNDLCVCSRDSSLVFRNIFEAPEIPSLDTFSLTGIQLDLFIPSNALNANLLYTQPTDWFSKQALSVSSMCFLIQFITGTTLETTLKNKRYHHQHQEQSHHLVAHTGAPSLVQTLILVGAQNADKHCLRTASIMEEFESRCINAKKSDSHSMQKQHLMLLGAHPILRSSLHVHVIGWDHSKNRSARVTNARLVLVWKYFYIVS